jgi:hypothetical protein
MVKLVRQLMVLAMLGLVSAGAFAQRKDQDRRPPPKEPAKVITNDRKENRPPSNSNRPKPDDRKRP